MGRRVVKKKIVKKKVAKKAVPKKKEDTVFVQLHSPVENRKLILRTAIESARLIQDYEMIKAIKKEKFALLARFEKLMKEIKSAHKLFLGTLPELKEEEKKALHKVEAPLVKEEAPIVEEKMEPEVQELVNPASEVDKLKEELANIESKLSKL